MATVTQTLTSPTVAALDYRVNTWTVDESSGTSTSVCLLSASPGVYRLLELRWKQTSGTASHGHPAIGVDDDDFTDDGWRQVAKASGTATEVSITGDDQRRTFTSTTGAIYLRSNWQSGTDNVAEWIICLERV